MSETGALAHVLIDHIARPKFVKNWKRRIGSSKPVRWFTTASLDHEPFEYIQMSDDERNTR